MGIKITDGDKKPELIYDRIFLVRLDINQEHQDIDNVRPTYNVRLRYRLYGVDDEGNRHYSNQGMKTIRIDDYLEMATMHAMEGNPACLEALQHIQEAVATLVAKQRNTTAVVI